MKNFFLVLIAITSFVGATSSFAQEPNKAAEIKKLEEQAKENLRRFERLSEEEYANIRRAVEKAVVSPEKTNKVMKYIGYAWDDAKAWENAGKLYEEKDPRAYVQLRAELTNEQKLRWDALLADVIPEEMSRHRIVNTLAGDIMYNSLVKRYEMHSDQAKQEAADAAKEKARLEREAAEKLRLFNEAETARKEKEAADKAAKQAADEKAAFEKRTADEFARRSESVRAEYAEQLRTLTDYMVRRTSERNRKLEEIPSIPSTSEKKSDGSKTYKAPSVNAGVVNPNDVVVPKLSTSSPLHPKNPGKLKAMQMVSLLHFLNSTQDDRTGSVTTAVGGVGLMGLGAAGFKYSPKLGKYNRYGQVASGAVMLAGLGLTAKGVKENLDISARMARIQALRKSAFGKMVAQSMGAKQAEELFRDLERGSITDEDLAVKYTEEADLARLKEMQNEEAKKVSESLSQDGKSLLKTDEEKAQIAAEVGAQRAMLRMMAEEDSVKEQAKFAAYLRHYDSDVRANTRSTLNSWDETKAMRIVDEPEVINGVEAAPVAPKTAPGTHASGK